MKKIFCSFVFIASFSTSILAQYQICPEAIAFPVKTGCEIEALPEGPCVRMGSVVYSSTHQSLVTYNGTNWTLPNGTSMSAAQALLSNIQTITLGTQAQDDAAYFGVSGAISDRYAVVSAPGISTYGASGYYGAIYIFKKNNLGVWTQVAVIENNPTNQYVSSGTSNSVFFGRSIDISGNDIIVGSYSPNTSITTGKKIHFFSIDPVTNVVSLTGMFTHPSATGDIGFGVKISGNYAIAPERPAPLFTCSAPSSSPDLYLRIYKKTGNSWAFNTAFLVGKNMGGAIIDGDLISVAQLTGSCATNLITYKLTGNTWATYSSFLNIPIMPISGSMSRCGNSVKILFTKQAGNSGELLGNIYSLNTSTNTISLLQSLYHTIYTANYPPFANGISYIYNGVPIIGYEISDPNADRYVLNYQIPNHDNRPKVIDADFGNLIYCSSGGAGNGYKVVIGKVF